MGRVKSNRKDLCLFESLANENDTFYGSIILAAAILAVAGFLVYINLGAYLLYASAKYKIETEATITDIRVVQKEQEVLDDAYKDEPPAVREKHTKTEKYDLYVIAWKYYVDDVKKTYTETDKYLSLRKVGDTKTLRLYSNDGVEYKRASHSALTNIILFLSTAVSLAMIYAIIRVIVARILLSVSAKHRKKKAKM